jgi:hypothetical protein
LSDNPISQAHRILGYRIRAGIPVTEENSMVEIHVRLLEEGTDCSRPTQGVVLGNGHLKLLSTNDYNAGDEHWEFPPGSIVRAKEVRNVDGTYLVAVAQEGF